MAQDTILIQNRYYPKGLTKQRIEKHYNTYKNYILAELNQKAVVLFVAPTTNNLIVKRNIDGQPIILTKYNYDNLMTNRVVSISVEFGPITDLWFVDIDPGKQVNKKDLINTTTKVVEIFKNLYETGYAKVKQPRVVTTSSGFHVMIKMKDRSTVKTTQIKIQDLLEKEFKKSELVVVNKRRKREDEIILDLSPLNKRGSRVVPYSLNRNGLMCIDVSRDWEKWNFDYGVLV